MYLDSIDTYKQIKLHYRRDGRKGIDNMYIDKLLDKIRKDKKELAKSYNVATSAIVYIGNNKYIVVKDGQEIRI